MSEKYIHLGIIFTINGPMIKVHLGNRMQLIQQQIWPKNQGLWLKMMTVHDSEGANNPIFFPIYSSLEEVSNLSSYQIIEDTFLTIKRIVHEGWKRKIGQVIVGISTYYTETQRRFILQCAKNVGIKNINLIDESMAYALEAYSQLQKGWTILINQQAETCEIALINIKDKQIIGKNYSQVKQAGSINLTTIFFRSILNSLSKLKKSNSSNSLSDTDWFDLFNISHEIRDDLNFFNETQKFLKSSITGLNRPAQVHFKSMGLRKMYQNILDSVYSTILDLLNVHNLSIDQISNSLICGDLATMPYANEYFSQKFDNPLYYDRYTALTACCRSAFTSGDGVRLNKEIPKSKISSENNRNDNSSLIQGQILPLKPQSSIANDSQEEEKANIKNPDELITIVHDSINNYTLKNQANKRNEVITKLEQLIKKIKESEAVKETNRLEQEEELIWNNYLHKLKKPTDQIHQLLNFALHEESIEARIRLLEKAVIHSTTIERLARARHDIPRLEAVAIIHMKAVEILLDGNNWDGSQDEIFDKAEKWLEYARRTIENNNLVQITSQLIPHFFELYQKRISFYETRKYSDKARKLSTRLDAIMLWGEHN